MLTFDRSLRKHVLGVREESGVTSIAFNPAEYTGSFYLYSISLFFIGWIILTEAKEPIFVIVSAAFCLFILVAVVSILKRIYTESPAIIIDDKGVYFLPFLFFRRYQFVAWDRISHCYTSQKYLGTSYASGALGPGYDYSEVVFRLHNGKRKTYKAAMVLRAAAIIDLLKAKTPEAYKSQIIYDFPARKI